MSMSAEEHNAAIAAADREFDLMVAELKQAEATLRRVRAEVQRMANDVAAGIPNTVGEYVGDLRRALDAQED